jgi:hypothetical protein
MANCCSVNTGSTQTCCCSDRREPRREWGFCSGSEDDGSGGCSFPFVSSLFLSFDRAPPVRPFDVLGLLFARMGTAGSADPGDSAVAVVVAAAATVVDEVVAEETGRDAAEARGVGLGSGEGMGCALSAGSSSMRSFSLRARVSRAADKDIGRGTTSENNVRKCTDDDEGGSGTFKKLERRVLSCDSCWAGNSAVR